MKFHLGQTKTVHVLRSDEKDSGIVLSLVVRISEKKHMKSLSFTDSSAFSNISEHFTKLIWPMTEQIFRSLGLPRRCFEVFFINPGEFTDEKELEFDNSLDVPLFLALLSAGLQLRVPNNLVSFGSIASFDGDIQLTKAMPLMMSTAVRTKSIQTVVYPTFNQNNLSYSFRSTEEKHFTDAIVEAKQHNLKLICVKDVGELVKAVFSEEEIISSSLRYGYYDLKVQPLSTDNSYAKAAKFFSANLEQRFFSLVKKIFLDGQETKSKELLLILVDHYLKKKLYPKKFAYNLLQVIQSLPPETIRFKISFPLLPINKCIQLIRYSNESDNEDILFLLKAISGETRGYMSLSGRPIKGSKKDDILDSAENRLRLIETEISAEALAKKFEIIGSGRAKYVIDSVTIKSYDEFYNSIIAFFVHLIKYARNLSDPIDMKAVSAEAFELLEKAFSKEGGVQAAYAEALFGLRGGMRLVLDQLTATFEQEEKFKYVNFVFKSVIDPLDWDGKVDLMGVLLERLKNYLPSEVLSQPPSRFVRHHETILRVFIQSMDQVKSLFHSY
jgi:hypothetical protein